MCDQVVNASEAMRESAVLSSGALIPALCGCRACGTVQMICAPVLGACDGCGAELTAATAVGLSTAATTPEAA